MLARVVTDLVRDALNDDTGLVWPDADLIKYLNNACLSVIVLRPDASYSTQSVTLAAGTRQSLPAEARRLIKLVRNTSGTKAHIEKVNRSALDLIEPDWHSSSDSTVLEYMYDETSPKEFYVYPGATSSPAVSVDMTYSTAPTVVADLDADDFPLDDSYSTAVIEHCLYQAWSTEDEHSPAYAKAGAKLNNFYRLLGEKRNTDIAMADA